MTMTDGGQQDPRVIVVQQPPAPPQPTQQPQTFTMEEVIERIEAARKEEKDKLYETQEQLNARLKVFEDERTALADQAEQARLAVEEADRLKQQTEMTALERLEAKEQEWSARFTEQQQALSAQQAIYEKEREFQALQGYRNQRLAELSESIDPRFIDFVKGNNVEEIEASLYIAAQKSDEIFQEVQEQLQGFQQPQQPPRTPGVPVTGGPGFTPEQLTNNPQQVTYTPEDLKAMPMSDFIAQREQLLAAASNQVKERGLYG